MADFIIYQKTGEPGIIVHSTGLVPLEDLAPQVVPDGANYILVEGGEAPEYNFDTHQVNLSPETNPTTYSIDPKPLDESKGHYKTLVSQESSSRLSSTTPLAIAALEGGPALSGPWGDYRAAVIAELNTKIAAIDGAADAEALATYVESDAFSAWPTEPTDPLV